MSHSNIVALIAGRLSRVPVVVREANVPLSSKQHSLSNRIIRGLVPLVYPWARAIISVSKDVADELCRMSEKLRPKITVLPTPVVSPGMLTMAEPDPGHPWLAPNQPPVILGVGRLHPQKDFATLLRAFAEVRARRPLRLLILGEGAERPALELLAAERGLQDDVALPGFVENPFPYMKRAAVLVLSSRYEGMPNALLQAMALGTPVISTDCPGGSRDALQDGRFGALVPVGDVAALAAAIEAALSGPRRSDAAEYVHSRFGVRQAADRYLEVLHAA